MMRLLHNLRGQELPFGAFAMLAGFAAANDCVTSLLAWLHELGNLCSEKGVKDSFFVWCARQESNL